MAEAPQPDDFQPDQLCDLAEDDDSYAGRLVRWAIAEMKRLQAENERLEAELDFRTQRED